MERAAVIQAIAAAGAGAENEPDHAELFLRRFDAAFLAYFGLTPQEAAGPSHGASEPLVLDHEAKEGE